MKTIQNKEFHSYIDRNSGKTFSDLEFLNCYFVECKISVAQKPSRRSTIRNVKFINCEQRGCTLYTAVVEDVILNSIKTNGLFQTWGAVFKHVTIKGKIGRIMTSPRIRVLIAPPEQQKLFDVANEAYYRNVDWALDIREAQFEEADLRGIPANLVLRDPETQFILTRERALNSKLENIDLSGTYWKTAIEIFLSSDAQDEVFVAPKSHPRFRPLLAGLWALRDAGVLE
jgi:hypothetical protein